MRILTAVGVGALGVLCVLRRHDLATAAGAAPPQALGALVVSGGAGAGALGAGLALSATSLAAVVLYGAALWLVSRGRASATRRSAPAAAPARRARRPGSG